MKRMTEKVAFCLMLYIGISYGCYNVYQSELNAYCSMDLVYVDSWVNRPVNVGSPAAPAPQVEQSYVDLWQVYEEQIPYIDLWQMRPTVLAGEQVSQEEDEQESEGHPFHDIIMTASQRFEVDPAMVKAIIMAESSYNPRAVSHRGASGLMQLMPTTAEYLGVEDIFNPEDNIHAGVKYYKQLLIRFDGDERLALAAYNAGSRKVRKYNGIPPYKATQTYIRRVLKYREKYRGALGKKRLISETEHFAGERPS
jgi:soluble lytic murein transglycosylase-like protein